MRFSKSRTYLINPDTQLWESMKEYEEQYIAVNKAADEFVKSICGSEHFNISQDEVEYEPDLYEAGGCIGIVTRTDVDKSRINMLVWTCEEFPGSPGAADNYLLWYPRVLGETIVQANEVCPVIIPEHFDEADEYRISQQIEQQMSQLPKIGTGTLAALLKVKSQYEHPTKEQIVAETSLSWKKLNNGYQITTGGLIIEGAEETTHNS